MVGIPRWLHETLGVICLLSAGTFKVNASCSNKQVEGCRNAVEQDNLSSLSSAGECTRSPYANEFTHACRVVSYFRPITDHCCCAHKGAALCCLYHQDAAYFRCHDVKDAVEVGSLSSAASSDDSLPLKMLLLVVIIPVVVVVLVCAVICVTWGGRIFRGLCTVSDEDDDSLGAEKGHLSTAMAGWLDSRDDLRQPARGRPAAAAAAGRQRASYGRLATITSETVLDSSPGPAPSAPPLEADGGGEGAAFLPGRDRTESDPPGHHHPLADGGYGRSVSVPANAVIHGGVAHHTCPSCSSIIAPPPAYDDDDAGRPPPPAYEAPDTAVPLRPPI